MTNGPAGRIQHASRLLAAARAAGDVAGFDAGIGILRQLLETAGPERGVVLLRLGSGLRLRFDVSGSATDLDGAIEAGRLAASEAANGAGRGVYLATVGRLLH